MGKKNKVPKQGRVWLNAKKNRRAHVMWSVTATGAEFSISDCNRYARLDFDDALGDIWGERSKPDKKDAWRKLAKLEAELAKFRAALEDQAGRSEE